MLIIGKRKSKTYKEGLIGTIVIGIVMVFASIITLYPFIYVISNSLSNPAEILKRSVVLWPVDFSLRSYEMLLSQKDVFVAYYNTIWYTVVGTLVNVVLTVMAAYPLSLKEFCFRKPIATMIAITMFVSGGIIPNYIVVNRVGLYDSPWALIIPTAISAYNLVVTRSFFESLPSELRESAYLDGANDFVVLWKIILPVSKAIMAVLVIFYAVGHWNDYFNPLIYLKSGDLKPIQIYLAGILVANDVNMTNTGGMIGLEQQYLFEALKFAVIVITVLPITFIYPFFQKHFVKGVMIGAVKS